MYKVIQYCGLSSCFFLFFFFSSLSLLFIFFFFPAAADVTVLGFFGEAGLQVMDVCCLERGDMSMPLVVTYNSTNLQHSVWSVHLAGREVSRVIRRLFVCCFFVLLLLLFVHGVIKKLR